LRESESAVVPGKLWWPSDSRAGDSRGGGRSVAPETLPGNAWTSLAGPAGDQAPVFVVWGFFVVWNKFACDYRFLLQAVNTKEGCQFFAPAGCSLELF